MDSPRGSLAIGPADRVSRLAAAFSDNAIATSATLHGLLIRLYRTDPEGLAHAQRVALLSVRIGEELGMAARALDDLERAAWLHDVGRVEYVSITDDEAVAAYQLCTRTEGIIPALESAHAIAHAVKVAPSLGWDHIMVVNMSGRGDKDLDSVQRYLQSHPGP